MHPALRSLPATPASWPLQRSRPEARPRALNSQSQEGSVTGACAPGRAGRLQVPAGPTTCMRVSAQPGAARVWPRAEEWLLDGNTHQAPES